MRHLMYVMLAFAPLSFASVTIPVTPQTCGYLTPTWGTCVNDSFVLTFNGTNAQMNIGGVLYSTDAFSLTGTDMALIDDGSVAFYLTVQIAPHSQTVNSGRTHYTRHWFTLDSGSITTVQSDD
jgi:hypothetical protein